MLLARAVLLAGAVLLVASIVAGDGNRTRSLDVSAGTSVLSVIIVTVGVVSIDLKTGTKRSSTVGRAGKREVADEGVVVLSSPMSRLWRKGTAPIISACRSTAVKVKDERSILA